MRPAIGFSEKITLLSLTGEDASAPKTNLAERSPGLVALGGTAATISIDFEVDENRPISFVALIGHDDGDALEMRITGASSQSGLSAASIIASGAPAASNLADPQNGRKGWLSFAAQPHNFWRLEITGRAGRAFRAERLLVGPFVQLNNNIGFSIQNQVRDFSRGARLDDGSDVSSEEGRVASGLRFTSERVTNTEALLLQDYVTRFGSQRAGLLIGDNGDFLSREILSAYGELDLRLSHRSHGYWRLVARSREI